MHTVTLRQMSASSCRPSSRVALRYAPSSMRVRASICGAMDAMERISDTLGRLT